MGPSDRPALLALTAADLAGCLALSEEAGWNQTEADWRVFLRDGQVWGLRDTAGQLIATGAALPYQGYGFVAMVLVTARARRQGHATRLVDRSVLALLDRGLIPVLDATPEGALVYARQGFAAQFGFARWHRPGENAPGSGRQTAGIVSAIALDAQAAGTERADLLLDFAARPGSRLTLGAGGFVLTRNGHRATQIGPLVAETEAEAIAMLQAALPGLPGRIFIDVPDRCTALLAWLQDQGFALARKFTRMALGRTASFGEPGRQFAMAGPEFG